MARKLVYLERADTADAVEIAAVFDDARAGMRYLPQLHTQAENEVFFERQLADPDTQVTKAVDEQGRILGFCVYAQGWLEHLYVGSKWHSRGVGGRLVEALQAAHPRLELWVFQENRAAIRFYKRHGFVLAEETNGERNEERTPDARYVWEAPGRAGNAAP